MIKKAIQNAKNKLSNASINTTNMDPADWMTDEEMDDYCGHSDDKDVVWGDPD